jgi:hypothetical protein
VFKAKISVSEIISLSLIPSGLVEIGSTFSPRDYLDNQLTSSSKIL